MISVSSNQSREVSKLELKGLWTGLGHLEVRSDVFWWQTDVHVSSLRMRDASGLRKSPSDEWKRFISKSAVGLQHTWASHESCFHIDADTDLISFSLFCSLIWSESHISGALFLLGNRRHSTLWFGGHRSWNRWQRSLKGSYWLHRDKMEQDSHWSRSLTVLFHGKEKSFASDYKWCCWVSGLGFVC